MLGDNSNALLSAMPRLPHSKEEGRLHLEDPIPKLGAYRLQASKPEAKSRRSASGSAGVCIPARPPAAAAQTVAGAPGPEPGMPRSASASLRALGRTSASPVLDNVMEHPSEAELGRSSGDSAEMHGGSSRSGVTPPSSVSEHAGHGQPGQEAAQGRPAGAQKEDSSKGASSAGQTGSCTKDARPESSGSQVSFHFASPFTTQASRPFSADVCPSSGADPASAACQ